MSFRLLFRLACLFLLTAAAPLHDNSRSISDDQINAIFPPELFHLHIPTTVEEREFIVQTVNTHPEDEDKQWAAVRGKHFRLYELARAVWTFMRKKEEALSPPGRLLFAKLIDGIPIVRFGDRKEIKTFVFETLRLWYSMDIPAKQNFIAVLPRSASALMNPTLVHYVLAEEKRES